MADKKTKSIIAIEEKMNAFQAGSLRYEALDAAKNFKSSWIKLGQFLYSIYKDKNYKEWGYLTFEAYCKKEVGIQKMTAVKLLSSYYFLEKNEPEVLKSEAVPNYEAVNVLRLARNNKDLGESDYQNIKKGIIDDGKDYREVKKEARERALFAREEANPEQARETRRRSNLSRLISLLKSLKEELKNDKLIPYKLVEDTEKLISKIEEAKI